MFEYTLTVFIPLFLACFSRAFIIRVPVFFPLYFGRRYILDISPFGARKPVPIIWPFVLATFSSPFFAFSSIFSGVFAFFCADAICLP